MTFKPEVVRVDVRLIGNVTKKVYAENSVLVVTEQKGREIYLGGCFLSIPFYPNESKGESGPKFDVKDTQIKIQYRTNSKNTRFGREEESPFLSIGHALLHFYFHPSEIVEIPTGLIL